MKFLIPTAFSILFCLTLNAQTNNGYYGKKAFIQVQTLMNYPLFSNGFTDNSGYGNYGYVVSGNNLVVKKDNLNVGYRVTAGYSIKRNISLLFEFGQDFSSINAPDIITTFDNLFNYSEIRYLRHEMLDLSTTVFMPIIEFGSPNALLPMGLSHQLGFGIANTKVIEKDYAYKEATDEYGQFYSSIQHYSTSINDPIDFKKITPVKKYVLMYGLSMRSPITKNLLINYGIKYTLNIGKDKYDYDWMETAEIEIIRTIYRHRSFSFINVNIGLAFAF